MATTFAVRTQLMQDVPFDTWGKGHKERDATYKRKAPIGKMIGERKKIETISSPFICIFECVFV